MRSKAQWLLLSLLLGVQGAFAGNGVPNLLPFQGRVTDVSGVPINYPVTVNIRILPPTGACYVYEDTQVVTPNAFGLFSVVLGSAGNSTGPANSLTDAFNNDVPAPVATNCGATTYAPASGDWRRLLIVVDGVPLPDTQTIAASAYSLNSQLLEGRSSSGFIQVGGNVNQAAAVLLTGGADASALHTHDSLYSRLDGTSPFTGSVTTNGSIFAPTAGASIGIGTTSTSADLEIDKIAPSLRLGAAAGGGGTSKIDFFGGLTQRGSIRASEGVNGLSFYSGSTLSLDLDQTGGATFYGPVNTLGTLGLAQLTNGQETTLLTNLNAADKGKMWYNTSVPGIKVWDGTAAVQQVALDGTGKLKSTWMPATGVATGSYGSSTDVPVFTVGADGRLLTAGTVTVSGTLPGGAAGGDLTGTYPNPTIANNAVTNAKLANDSITSAKILSTGIAVNRLIMTDNTLGNNLKYSTCALGETLLWTATGWTCTPLNTLLGTSGATAGTYGSATQVPQLTVDAQGRVTNAANVAIAYPVLSVAGRTGAVILTSGDVGGLGTSATLDVGLSPGNVLQLDGGGHIPSSILPSSAGTITQVVAGTSLLGGGPSGVVTLNVDVGTTANQILKLNGSAQIPAVDGSLLTFVNAVKLRGNAVAATAPSANQVLTWNGTTTQWEPSAAPVLSVASKTGAVTLNYADILSAAGVYLSYKPNNAACADQQILVWNNTASRWECGSDNNAGGTITNITTGNGLLGGSISLAGTIAVDTGTAAGKILQLNGSAQIPGVDGSLVTNINAVRIGAHTVATALPVAGQFLGWNSLTSQWEPITTPVGTVTSVGAGTGLTGGPITANGTLNVDVGTTGGKIVQLTGGAQYPGVDGNLITNVNAVKLQTRNVSATAPVAGTVLGWNALSSVWEPTIAALGSVTNVAVGNGLIGGPISTTGTLAVDTGTAAGKILQLNGSAQIPGVDGSLVTNINATRIGTHTVSSAAPVQGQYIGWNSSTSVWEPTIAVTSVTTGNGLTGGTITAAGTITVDTGTTPGKILQLTGAAQIPAVDGYLVTNINAQNIQGKQVSATAPTDAQILAFNGGNGKWAPVSVSGDVAMANTGAQSVIKIRSVSVSATTPTAGQVLTFNNLTSQWEGQSTNYSGAVVSVTGGTGLLGGTITSNGTFNVDVGTTAGKIVQITGANQYPVADGNLITNVNAINIRGKFVSATAPTDAQVMLFNATTNNWVPGSLSGDIAANNLGATTVAAIQGKAVKAGTPTAGQVLTWNNSTAQWDFENTNYSGAVVSVTGGTGLLGGIITSNGTLNVDVGTTAGKIVQITGANQYPAADGNLITNVNAINIRGKFVSATAPTDAQVMLFNATTNNWVPGSFTGDVAVNNAGASTVAAIQGKAVKAGTPTAGQVLTWNNATSQWDFENTNYSGAVVSVTAGTGLTGGTIISNGTINVDTGTTSGKIVQITGANQYPVADGNLITNVNAINIRGKLVSATAPTDAQVMLFNATTNTWVPGAFSGDVGVNNLGASTVAAIQGKAVKAGTPSANQVMTWNNTTAQWDFQTPTTGTITSIIAGTGLTGGTITTTGSVAIDVGVTTGKIIQVAAGNTLPAIDGSLLTNITPANIGGVVPVANGGTNSATALNSNRMMISSGGKIVEAAAMTDGQIIVGKNASAPQIVSAGGDVSAITNAGVFTVSKVNSVAYPASPAIGTLPSVTSANTITYSAAPVLGVNASAAGSLGLANAAVGGATTTIQPSTSTLAAWTLTLPQNGGTNNYILQTNGSGVTSWVAPASLTGSVNSGTANQLTYYAATGSAVSGNANATINNGALTLGQAGTIGNLILTGNTSGAVTVAPQAAAGTYNFNLPTTAGGAGTVLTSGGGAAAPMTWTTLANSATIDATNAANISIGTLSAARMPALTGDTTMSANTTVTTTSKVNGVAYPTGPAVGTVPAVTAANTVTYTATPTHGVNASVTGTLALANGAAGGASTTIQPSASALAPWTLTLPPDGGTNNFVLKTNGSGVATWVSPATLTGSVASGTANQLAYFSATGTALAGNANATIVNGALTLGQSTSTLGTLVLSGNTSGAITVAPQAAAGTYNFNLPIAAGASGSFLTSAGGAGAPMTWTTVVPVAAGGTGTASGTQGGMPYYSASTTMASTAAGTSGQVLVSGGTGAPTWTSTPSVTSLAASGGSIVAADTNVATTGTVNFATGNVQVLQAVGGTVITTSGMVSGGAYTIILNDTTSRTYTFAGQCATNNYIPANAPTQAGKKSVYTILYSTNLTAMTCLISWVSGF